MGIGVSSNVVAAAASLIGCSILTALFNYLGAKVASNISRITSWDDVISKNFFYGVDGLDGKLAWIGWNMVLTSKKNGGLGTYFIKAIFGNKGALDTHKLIPRRSPWQDVIFVIHSLQSKSINLMDLLKKVGNSENTSFWDDSWLGEVALKVLYKMLYALEMCKSIRVAEKIDRWYLSLEGSQEFSFKSSRILIDNTILPKAEVPTRWLKVVPIKVNVHAWRVFLDKLPTRANLSLRGMYISSIACPLCNSAMESSSYIFSLIPWLAKFGESF
uniref:RNA-directed DNA polymerase, eukaryota n=1 Tax=Tanacetum cinerariifolium TaxID=118510 RepID=A0A6L2LP35_TANCI|nr:RNA-directed DNA polymerase, eukaryota [Tanacetum cinerariifolium]